MTKSNLLTMGKSLLTAATSRKVKGEQIVLMQDIVVNDGNFKETKKGLEGEIYSLMIVTDARDENGEFLTQFQKGLVFEIDKDDREVIIDVTLSSFKALRTIRAKIVNELDEEISIWFRCEGKETKGLAAAFCSMPVSLKVVEQFKTVCEIV